MKRVSFSAQVKEHLLAVPIKKKCCRHALDDGLGVLSGDLSPSEMIKKAVKGSVCPECMSHLLGGLFCTFGNVTDPAKRYHLEFTFSDDDTADAVSDVLTDCGFPPSRSVRKGRVILYYKSSTAIEDLLGFIGATFGAFDVMNAKIVKEMRGDTNRQVNCDSANIAKTLSAAEKHIEMIEELRELGLFNGLTGDLKETAEIRAEFPDLSLAELGQKFIPPISKSGIKHRLDKITDYYESNVLNKSKD